MYLYHHDTNSFYIAFLLHWFCFASPSVTCCVYIAQVYFAIYHTLVQLVRTAFCSRSYQGVQGAVVSLHVVHGDAGNDIPRWGQMVLHKSTVWNVTNIANIAV